MSGGNGSDDKELEDIWKLDTIAKGAGGFLGMQLPGEDAEGRVWFVGFDPSENDEIVWLSIVSPADEMNPAFQLRIKKTELIEAVERL